MSCHVSFAKERLFVSNFAVTGKSPFILNELSSSITTLRFKSSDKTEGEVHAETISTLPPGFAAHNAAAEIIVHPNGRRLYASNRGHDSIIQFTITDDAHLVEPQWISSNGQVPRNMVLDPTGQFLLVANQESNTIQIFAIERAPGSLTPVTAIALSTPMGMCCAEG